MVCFVSSRAPRLHDERANRSPASRKAVHAVARPSGQSPAKPGKARQSHQSTRRRRPREPSPPRCAGLDGLDPTDSEHLNDSRINSKELPLLPRLAAPAVLSLRPPGRRRQDAAMAMWARQSLRGVAGVAGVAVTGPVYQTASRGPARSMSRMLAKKIGILGVPFEKGQRNHGVSGGPRAIREAGLVDALRTLGHDVQDFGDVSYDNVPDLVGPENLDKYQHVVACMREVSGLARRIQSEGRICLALGGDHSVTIGTVDATVNAHEDVAVIWVDAHADLNTPATSPSGSAHGMPVALLAKDLADYWPYLPGMDWQVPKLPLSNLAYIGLRSVDEYERLTMEKFNVCAFGMQDVESLGITGTVELALRHVDPHKRRAIHLSFDIDALDALEAPSTGCPVRGGLTLREAIHIMERVHETGRLAAIDLVEVNPSLGSAADVRTTVQAALQLLVAAFGHSRLGNMPRQRELPLTKGATLKKDC